MLAKLDVLLERVRTKLYRKETGYSLNYLTLQVKDSLNKESIRLYKVG